MKSDIHGIEIAHHETIQMPCTHELKTNLAEFNASMYGHKSFEVRKNDRDFKVGDFLQLMEWDAEKNQLTGRELMRQVTFILQGKFGLPEDVCVMAVVMV